MDNKICPECGKQFHYCKGCNIIYEYEKDYCSLECFKKSLTYEWNKTKLMQLITLARKDFLYFKELSNFFTNELKDNVIYLYDEDMREIWNQWGLSDNG